MKRIILSLGLLVSLFTTLIAQSYTVELRPGEATGKDAFILSRSNTSDQNFGDHPHFQLTEWTAGGIRLEQHEVLDFDLSVLPDNARIESARLSLYFDPDNLDGRGFGHYGDVPTDFYIQKITEAWNPGSVTWNSRPSVDTTGQILLQGHTEIDQNYEDIDVTEMIAAMFADDIYGLYFQLATDDLFQVIKFGSSNHPNYELRPKLVITYEAERCGVFSVSDGAGKDARVLSLPAFVDRNFGDDFKLAVQTWTSGATPFIGRTFMGFDLSSIDTTSTINSADLFLYFDPLNADANGVHSDDNAMVISPITAGWSEDMITWNNQPPVDEASSFVVPATVDPKMDFLGYDITELIQAQRADGNDNGFRMSLETEETFRNVQLAGGEHPEPGYHAKLKVCWDPGVSTTDALEAGGVLPEVFPNPSNGYFQIDFTDVAPGKLAYRIADLSGRQIGGVVSVPSRGLVNVNLSNQPRGRYLITATLNGRLLATKRGVTVGIR